MNDRVIHLLQVVVTLGVGLGLIGLGQVDAGKMVIAAALGNAMPAVALPRRNGNGNGNTEPKP